MPTFDEQENTEPPAADQHPPTHTGMSWGSRHSHRASERRGHGRRHLKRALALWAVVFLVVGLAVPAGLLLVIKAPASWALVSGAAFELVALVLGLCSWKYNRAKVVVMLVVLVALYALLIGRQSTGQDAGGGGGAATSGTDGGDPKF